MAERSLNARQQRFVEEYLLDLNATQAAVRAGYSKKTAHVIGHENLTKPEIAAAVEAAKAERSKRTEITSDYVLAGLREVAERCLQKAPVMVGRGEDRAQAIDEQGRHVWTFDSSGANRSLELLGKHLALFTDRHEHSGNLTVLPASIDDLA